MITSSVPSTSRELLKQNFEKSLKHITQNPAFERVANSHSIKLNILQPIHRKECIALISKEFSTSNALRKLLGFGKDDYLMDAIKIVDHAIDSGMTVVIQDKNCLNKESNDYKVIGVINNYDFVENRELPIDHNHKSSKFASIPIDNSTKNNNNNYNRDSVDNNNNNNNINIDTSYDMLKYLLDKYEYKLQNDFVRLTNICKKNGYGECNYFDIGCMDSDYSGKKIWQRFGVSIGWTLPICMKYKYIIGRLSDIRTIHINNKIKKRFDNTFNDKNMFQMRLFWDYSNDKIFEQFMFKKFGRENALKRMKKYGTVLSGILIDTSNNDSTNWTPFDMWKFVANIQPSKL